MARLRTRIERAAALHRRAAALVAAATAVLDAYAPVSAPTEQYAEQHDLAAALRADASHLAPGWLGAGLDGFAPTSPLGGPLAPTFVRIGQGHPLDDARFPVVVPLLRAGHIAIDADARDMRVAGLLRSLVLRLLATAPPGSVLIRAIDAADIGATFGVFTGIDHVMPPPATDADSMRAVLAEGERWAAARDDGPGPTMLIVIASLPELTDGSDLARVAGLAHAGPAGRLHLIAAGWPPPPLTAETTQAPLPHATHVALRNPYCWVGDPPGATFAAGGLGPGRLNAPVYLDPDPPIELVRQVCAQVALGGGSGAAPVAEPSRTAWLEYVAAAQRLDSVRRTATAVVAEHTKAHKAARDDLAVVRAKLATHRAWLTEAALADGRSVDLVPGPGDASAAQALLAAPPMRSSAVQHVPGRVAAALRSAATTLDSAEATMTGPDRRGTDRQALDPQGLDPQRFDRQRLDPPGPDRHGLDPAATPPRLLRNITVYGAFAALAALVQVPMLIALLESARLAVLAVPCALVLPAVAFLLGWLTVGAIAAPGERGRSSVAGLAVSLIALIPLIAVVGWVGLERLVE